MLITNGDNANNNNYNGIKMSRSQSYQLMICPNKTNWHQNGVN